MTRNILLVLTLIAAIGLAAWLWRTDAASTPIPDSGTSASLDVTAPTSEPTPAPRPAAPLPPLPELGSAAFSAENTRQTAETHQRLEQIWSADRVDAAQTAQIEQNLLEKAASKAVLEIPDQPTRIVSIGCRKSMCRIETTFPGGSSPSEWGTRMLIEMAPAFSNSTQVSFPGEKGQATVVLYAFRPGAAPRR